MTLPLNQVVQGDCIEVMAEWPKNSIDCIVTDPPYGISFMGKEWDKALPPVEALEQMIRVLKPGALAFVMSSPRQDVLWRMLAMLEGVGFQLRQSAIFWIFRTGFPKALDVSKGIDRKLGFTQNTSKKSQNSAFRKIGSGYEGGFKPEPNGRFVTQPASDLAKQWGGWKSQTGLKPAAECVLMVNKPRSEPTIVDNILKWGTGGINVDACRIPFKVEPKNFGNPTMRFAEGESGFTIADYKPDGKGRFPANLLISDGALDTGETTKSMQTKENDGRYKPQDFLFGGSHKPSNSYDDEGSPYRFFDLDAWAEHHGFLDVAKPSRAERDFGLWNFDRKDANKWSSGGIGKRRRDAGLGQARNIHPTTKPIRLMAYLITLGCPPKGIVVDPFLGSGTTCIAAKRLRRKWIGIEINPEYAEIAEARINIRGPLDPYMEAEK